MPSEPTLEECFMATHAEKCDPTTEEPVDGHILRIYDIEGLENNTESSSLHFIRRPNFPEGLLEREFFEKYPQFAATSPTRDSAFKDLAERANAAPPPHFITLWTIGDRLPAWYRSAYLGYHEGLQEGATEEQEIAAIQQIKIDYPVHSRRILYIVQCLLSDTPQTFSEGLGEIIIHSAIRNLLKYHSTAQLALLERKWS